MRKDEGERRKEEGGERKDDRLNFDQLGGREEKGGVRGGHEKGV